MSLTELDGHAFDALPTAILVANPDGRIVIANRRAATLLGYRSAELAGLSLEAVIAEPSGAALRRRIAGLAVRPRRADDQLEVRMRRADGTDVAVVVALGRLVLEGAPLVAVVIPDLAESQRTHDHLQAMVDVTEAMLDGQPLEEVFRVVARDARRLIGGDGAALGTVTHDGTRIVLHAVDGDGVGQDRVGRAYPLEHTLAARVLRSGRSIRVRDASQTRRAAGQAPSNRAIGPAIVVPLAVRRRVFGALRVHRAVGAAPFRQADVRLVEGFAAQASAALEYSRARDDSQRLAVVEERERIARDLHDGVIQSLFGIGLDLQRLAAADQIGQAASARLAAAVDGIESVIHDLRGYIFGLRPGILADRQLHDALRGLAGEFAAKTGIRADVDVDPLSAALLGRADVDVLQVAREALSNVARHAQADACRLTLRRDGRAAVLEIADAGRGFDPAQVNGGGHGLANIRERAAALGGEARIAAAPGQGTSVRISLPL